MTMALRAACAVAATALLAAGCNLPERDNANDPSVRPRAVLQVFHAPAGPDGVCPSTIEAAGETFSRNRCVLLHAGGSTDPQGDIAEYRYDLAYEGPDDEVFDRIATTGTGELFTPSDLAPAGLGPRTVRLRVVDAGGRWSEATADFELTNEPPTVAAPPLRVLPHRGLPWGASVTNVRVQTQVLDPDEDTTSVCWTVIDDAGVSVTPAASCAAEPWVDLQVGAGSSPGTIRISVHAEDGTAAGPSTEARIVLDRGPGWTFLSSLQRAAVVDLERVTWPALPRMEGRPALLFDAAHPDDPTVLYPHRSLSGEPGIGFGLASGNAAVLPLPDDDPFLEIARIHPDVERKIFWTIGRTFDPANGSMRMKVWVFDKETAQFHGPWPDDAGMAIPAGNGDFFAITERGSAGRFWVAPQLEGSTAWALTFDPQAGTILQAAEVAFDRGMVSALADRSGPAGPEVWIVQSWNPSSDPETFAPAAWVWRDGTLDPVPYGFSFDGLIAWGLEFFAGDAGWVNFFGDPGGLARVDVDDAERRLRSGTPIAGSGIGFRQTIEPVTGERLMVGSNDRRIVRASPSGVLAVVDTDEEVLDVVRQTVGDPRIWTVLREPSTDGFVTHLAQGRGSGRRGILRERDLPTVLATPASDLDSGDLWVPTVVPGGLLRLSPELVATDFVSRVEDAVETRLLPPPVAVVPDPGSGAVWVLAGDAEGAFFAEATSVYRLDPDAPRTEPLSAASGWAAGEPIAFALPSGGQQDERARTGAVQGASGNLVVLTADPTAEGSDPATDPPRLRLRRFDASGELETLLLATYDPPSMGLGSALTFVPHVAMARDASDDGLCLTYPRFSMSGPERVLARRDADLALEGEIALSWEPFGVAAALGDCWVAFVDGLPLQWRIARYRASDGTLLESEPIADAPQVAIGGVTMSPVRMHSGEDPDGQAIWLSVRDGTLRRMVVTSSGTAIAAGEEIPLEAEADLLVP